MDGWNFRLTTFYVTLVLSTATAPAWCGVSQDNIVRGEKIYKTSCTSCHSNEKSGAPQLTDKKAWETRITQPRKRLMQHVLKGFGKMPARGGDSSLNVHNVADALDYMLFTILGLEDVVIQSSKPPSTSDKAHPGAKAAADNGGSALQTSTLTSDTKQNSSPTSSSVPEHSAAAASVATDTTRNVQAEGEPGAANQSMTDSVVASAETSQPYSDQTYRAAIDTFLEQISVRRQSFTENDLGIPQDKYGDDVRLGYRIFTQTAEYASRYAGNDLSCSNCHLDAGLRANAIPIWGAVGMYPAYKRRNDRNNTLEDRIQQCFQFSLNGFAPAPDSPEVIALMSYMHFISRGVPIGVNLPGRGLVDIENTGFDPNPTRGLKHFEKYCSVCHQADGSGKRSDNGKSYIIPPLWGRHAYNKAAGFNEINKLAGFIKSNMPPGQEQLSVQEALDIAAFLNQQIRPGDPRKGLFDAWFGE